MAKYYSHYVRHMLRFYCRCDSDHITAFRSEVDKLNYGVCEKVVQTLTEDEKAIIYGIIVPRSATIEESIFNYSSEQGIPQSVIWDLLKLVEKKVATERGLI